MKPAYSLLTSDSHLHSYTYQLTLDKCACELFKPGVNTKVMVKKNMKFYEGLNPEVIIKIHNFVSELRKNEGLGQRKLARRVKGKFKVEFSENTISGWIHNNLIPYANEKTQFKPKPIPPKEELGRLYLNKKLSASTLAKKFEVSPIIVINWLRHYNLKVRSHLESMNTRIIKRELRNKQLTTPTKNYRPLTPEKAYILGVLAGDGFINRRLIRLEIRRDTEFIEKFSNCLKRVYGIKYTYYYYKLRNSYILHATSEIICEDLLNYGDFRTNSWKVPKKILESRDRLIQKEYVKGLYDSEGSAGKYLVTFSSNSKEGIGGLKVLLENLGIISRIRKIKPIHYGLFISKRENLEKFKKEIGFVMQRKMEKLRW